MAKTLTHTQVFNHDAPKKGSALFRAKDKDINTETALQTSIYAMRNAAKKVFGITDLDSVEQIEVTYKVTVSGGNGKGKKVRSAFWTSTHADEDED